MTTLVNAVVWLLVLATWRPLGPARGGHRLAASARSLPWPWLPTPVLIALAAVAAAGLISRVALGVIVPGDFAQEVVAYQSWTAGDGLYPADFQARFRTWVETEPSPLAPMLPEWLRMWREHKLEALIPRYSVQAHPPPMMLALAPAFALLGSYWTFLMYSIAGVAALAVAVVALRSTVRVEFKDAGWLLVILLGWQPVLANVRHGQPGLIVAASLIGGYLALRSRHDVACGALVALAASLKVFPALLLVPLAVRRPRAFVAALATLGAVVVATCLVAGPGTWIAFLREARAVSEIYGAAPNNFALRSLLVGMFGSAGAFLSVAAAAGLIIATLTRGRARRCNDETLYAQFICLALLLSPTCWSHYFVLLLVPAAVAADELVMTDTSAVASVAACGLALSLPDQPIWRLYYTIAPIAGSAVAHLAASFPSWAVLALWWRVSQPARRPVTA